MSNIIFYFFVHTFENIAWKHAGYYIKLGDTIKAENTFKLIGTSKFTG